jgi:hypothetical protein
MPDGQVSAAAIPAITDRDRPGEPWRLANPAAVVAEMARMVRPTGRRSLIDTDWSTFAIDVDDDLAARVRNATWAERGRRPNIGRRLHDFVRAVGIEPVASTEATQIWPSWNSDD